MNTGIQRFRFFLTAYSGTYTFAANDTGGTKDLGTNHTYRYVNATNVYNKGKSDGGTSVINKLNTNPTHQAVENGATYTFTGFTNGKTYLMMIGGFGHVSSMTMSGGTLLKNLTSVFTKIYSDQKISDYLQVRLIKMTSTSLVVTYESSIKEIAYIQLD